MTSRLYIVLVFLHSLVISAESFLLSTRTAENKNGVAFGGYSYSPSKLRAAFTTSPVRSQQSIQDSNVKNETIIGNVVFLLPSQGADSTPTKFGTKSPIDCPSVMDACNHLAKKTGYFSDETIQASVETIPLDKASAEAQEMKQRLLDVNALIAFGLSSEPDLQFASDVFEARRKRQDDIKYRQCQFALECTKTLPSTVSMYDNESNSNPPLLPSLSLLSSNIPWTDDASAKRLYDQMMGLFNRWTSDDFTVALMLFFNQYSGNAVDWVKHSIDATWEKGPVRNVQEFYTMVSKCGDCITRCIADENCKACLDALNDIDTRDQVASYRTVVSYESELLRDFSQCILQRHNVFNCDATIPTRPNVTPISTWRGKPLTFQDARSILVGHLDDEAAPEGGWKKDVSWEVACGGNVAYDQFPSQNQIFYESVNGKDMWYDPVFRVETIDGRNVWCKRHYKVRDGPVPGTFRFSVLDNGVTSNEFWTIAGVADDLSWIVFHYAGAAGAVGQRYLGGLLCTPDGSLPPKEKQDEIWSVLRGAGMEPWEMYVVDNDPNSPGAIDAGPPPLSYYLDDVRAAKRKRLASKA